MREEEREGEEREGEGGVRERERGRVRRRDGENYQSFAHDDISLAVSLTDVWVTDETHSHLMVSSCRLIGWAAEELLGTHFSHVAPCDSTRDSRSMFQR